MNDEFYVGYAPQAPDGLARAVVRVCVVLAALIVAAALGLAIGQTPYPTSRFEYGVTRSYTGVLETLPVPMLLQRDSHFLLVAPGKHALHVDAALDGRTVQLQGTLIERAGDRMLQTEAVSIRAMGEAVATPARISLGEVTLHGEIVDAKCYLGVMNPGESKVHRECAARCISGGVPAGFVAHDADGTAKMLLLTDKHGHALGRSVLDRVAEPVEISGELVKVGSAFTLRTEPTQIRRFPAR
jgi:hypothetical protein